MNLPNYSEGDSEGAIICVVKVGHSGFDQNDWNEHSLSYSNIRESITNNLDYYKIHTVNDLMTSISDIIKPSDTSILNITDFYYDSETVFQAIYNQQDPNESNNDINILATQLIQDKCKVKSDMIVVKRCIINNDFKYLNVNINDIITLIQHVFIHKAVYIKPNNDITEFNYVYNALDLHTDKLVGDNIRYHEFKMLNYTLLFYVNINSDRNDNNINLIASTIYKTKIYGDVFISLFNESEHNSSSYNYDLTIEFVLKLYELFKRINSFDDLDVLRYKNTKTYNESVNDDYLNDSFNKPRFPEITYFPNFFYFINAEYNRLINNPCIFDINTCNNVLNDIK